MTDFDSDRERQKFAVERSHRDAENSNSTARATAQAAILINGGAATAVLAILSKDKLNPIITKTAAVCLGGYAFGVLFGACMMYCFMHSLDYYSLRWRLKAQPEEGADAEASRRVARTWLVRTHWCFRLSMGAFVLSSFVLAVIICSYPLVVGH